MICHASPSFGAKIIQNRSEHSKDTCRRRQIAPVCVSTENAEAESSCVAFV
jgi:hypothetical protein